MSETDVKVIMSICPECGNALRIAIEHEMDKSSKREFAKEVRENDLQVQTISLEEYRNSDISLYCKGECPRKNKTIEIKEKSKRGRKQIYGEPTETLTIAVPKSKKYEIKQFVEGMLLRYLAKK